MQIRKRLRIAIQKKGRLNSDSMDLLRRCGVKIRYAKSSLYCHAENLPIDVLFVRDDDIPTLVMDHICDIGIVGENILLEKGVYQRKNELSEFELVQKLGFSQCRLSIAIPQVQKYTALPDLSNKRIATTYPHLLSAYLNKHKINAEILKISGSVEVAPQLQMADAICDLVSTGRTLEEHNLKEIETIIKSQAVLIKNKNIVHGEKVITETYELLLRRIRGVLHAQENKYIMFHVKRSELPIIKNLLPGSESPTIMPLATADDKVAVHVVSPEAVFWTTLETLKKAGASSILVFPIEKMLK
jgi:ATP phosphoribosyltransferase